MSFNFEPEAVNTSSTTQTSDSMKCACHQQSIINSTCTRSRTTRSRRWASTIARTHDSHQFYCLATGLRAAWHESHDRIMSLPKVATAHMACRLAPGNSHCVQDRENRWRDGSPVAARVGGYCFEHGRNFKFGRTAGSTEPSTMAMGASVHGRRWNPCRAARGVGEPGPGTFCGGGGAMTTRRRGACSQAQRL